MCSCWRNSNSSPPDGDVGTQEIRRQINEWKNKSRNVPMDEGKVKELVVDMDKYLLEKAGLDKCEDKEKKGKFNSCDCLTILRNNANRWAVARFSVKFMQRHRIEQSQTIIDWYRFASMQPGKKQFYIMPYDATDNGEVGDISDDLRSKIICRSAMMTLVQIGKKRMGNIKTQANITGTATEHGNKGKRKRLAETDPKLIGVRDHFASVELLATQIHGLQAPGINVFKKVELYTKYLRGAIVPLENRNDPLYKEPTVEEMNRVKQEKTARKKFRLDLNEQKASGFAADAKMEASKDECMESAM